MSGYAMTFDDPDVEDSFIKYSWNISHRALMIGSSIMLLLFTLYLAVLESIHDVILFGLFQNGPCLVVFAIACVHKPSDPVAVIKTRRRIAATAATVLCLAMGTFSTSTSELNAVFLTSIVLVAVSVIIKMSFYQKTVMFVVSIIYW